MATRRLRLVADDLMPGVEACCARLRGVDIDVVRRPGRQLAAADVAGADLLLVRSVTRVDGALLGDSPVRFVGTATIGTDHLDLDWLDAQGLAWSAAPGCNARAVGEWVLAALARLAVAQDVPLAGRRLGIVGLGHVGRQLALLARAAGLTVLACDPFLTAADLPPALADIALLTLDDLLAETDTLSLHVPLTRGGAHPTHHLFDAARLARLRQGSWLINAARGGVIDNAALRERLAAPGLTAVLDVWEGEPRPDPALLARVWQGSAHIAGHSLEGKWRGTWQIMQAAAAHLGTTLDGRLEDILPSGGGKTLTLAAGSSDQRLAALLSDVIAQREDDAALREGLAGSDPAAAFDALRKGYGLRREFPAHQVVTGAEDLLRPLLQALGFALA